MTSKTIMFASPFNLFDRSSGASISCHTLLRQLMERGDRVVSVCATIFDNPQFSQPQQWLAEMKAEPTDLDPRFKIFRLERDGMVQYVVPARNQKRPMMLAREEEAWWALFRKAVLDLKPDLVIGFGGQTTEQLAWRWLKDRGIPTMFYLVNAGYLDCDWFGGIGAVVTDTDATAQMYREKTDVKPHVIGKFIVPAKRLRNAPRDHILFINPAPEKGVSLFIGLAQRLAETHPEQRFLVVESRAKIAPAMRKLGVERLPNVTLLPLQADMTKVWNRTKLLLVPSLWHESGSRSVVEAMELGIPVLASASGGTAEMLNQSGFMFPLADRTRSAYLDPFTDDELKPWLTQMHLLLDKPDYFAEASKRSRVAWEKHPKVNSLAPFDLAFELATIRAL